MKSVFILSVWLDLAVLRHVYATRIPHGFHRVDNDTLVTSPPWFDTIHEVAHLPECANASACMGSSDRMKDCTATKCVQKNNTNGLSVEWLKMTDTSCLCSQVNFTSCLYNCQNSTNLEHLFDFMENTCSIYSWWKKYERPYNSTNPGSPAFLGSATAPKCMTSNPACISNSNTVFNNASQLECGRNWYDLKKTDCMCLATNATACLESCGALSQRRAALNWMDTQCSLVAAWGGLPSNWKNLLVVHPLDLLPWQLDMTPSDPALLAKCPSAKANLSTFAIVNAVILVLTGIFSRRDVVRKVTFKILGKPYSRTWMLVGPISAAFQVAANFGNAALISKTPGFEHVNIVRTAMLWLTRPRLGWVIVVLVTYGSEKAIYLSPAVSALASECILQLIATYVFGTIVDHGNREGFYNIEENNGGQLGNDSKFKNHLLMMYGSSLAWLITMGFGVFACLLTILSISSSMLDFKHQLGGKRVYWRENRCITEYRRMHLALASQLVDRGANVEPSTETLKLEGQMESLSHLISCSEEVYKSLLTETTEFIRITKLLKKDPEIAQEEKDSRERIRELLTSLSETLDIEASSRIQEAIDGSNDFETEEANDRFLTEEQHREPNHWKKVHFYWINAAKRWASIRDDRLRGIQIIESKNPIMHPETLGSALSIVGMAGCWAAQWVWWAGFVETMGDL